MLPLIMMAQWGEMDIPISKDNRYSRKRILNNLIKNMVCVDGGLLEVDDSTRVKISTFYIGKYEVTQEEWWAVTGHNPSASHADKSYPITDVSWYDCQNFIQELNKWTGLYFRMPTEAEWIFAAIGGNNSRDYRYAGSNMLETVAWFADNSKFEVQRVGEKQPNELGLYDMSGNVEEWVYDWYGKQNWSSSDPTGPLSGSYKRLKGGSVAYIDRSLAHLSSGYRSPESRSWYGGLRLAMSEKPERVHFDVPDFTNGENQVYPIPTKSKDPNMLFHGETPVYDVAEYMPEFPGSAVALFEYLSRNIKYPVVAEENGIQGRVVCQFVVEKDGSITDVRVVKSVDPSLDKEAQRVVKSMPRWIPGKQNGSAVRVKYTVPVTFRLQ